MTHPPRATTFRTQSWLLAPVAVAIVFAVRLALQPLIGTASPFLLFTLAVVVSAWRGGFWPGVLSTALSGGVGMWFVLQQGADPVEPSDYVHWMQFSLFTVVGLLVSGLAESVLRYQAVVVAERARLAEALMQAPAFMCILGGPEHVYKWENERHRQLIGHRDVIGKSVRKALPEVAEQGFVDLLDRVYRTGEPFVATGLTVGLQRTPGAEPEPRILDFVYQPLREGGGPVSGILAHGVDLTERTKTERALRESEERFRLMVESVRDYGIFMLDVDGRITSWNAGAERIEGYAAAEAIGLHFSIFYTEEDRGKNRPAQNLAETVANGSYAEEGWRVRKDGSRYWASVVLTAVRDHEGKHVGFAKVSRDLTERKRAEEALHQLNQELEERVKDRTAELELTNKELEAFSYSVSHDLRAPLRGIDGFAKLLLTNHGASVDEKGRHFLERIRAGTQRMGKLIDDLLELSKLSRAELRRVPVDLATIARDVVDELRRSAPERQVDVRIPAALPASGDPALLRVVLDNLVGNAWKFSGKSANASIEIGETIQGSERVFHVRDNGAGFDMEYAGKLFAPFQRLHSAAEFEGTGIGLASAQRIIARHGGRIWAEGKPGEGATFRFTLNSSGVEK